MRWSKSHIFTFKEAPADAEIPSHQLMMRAGMIKKVGPGLYTYGTLALRSIRKVEQIIREELAKVDCQEVLMPMVQPKSLWEETNRWTEMGAGLLKFKNRNDHDFCLGATHEEVITDYVRGEVKSYKHLPVTLYQVQTKYRDEIRPRFGLMRGREFIMKDAYSFDVNSEAALASYRKLYGAYQAIFDRLGLEYRIVQADAGSIGGSQTHEFQVLADAGEDQLLVAGDYAANVEIAPAQDAEPLAPFTGDRATLEEFETPGQRTIADLEKFTKVPAKELVKTLFFAVENNDGERQSVCVLLRGSDELNLVKLKNALGVALEPEMLTDAQVRELTGASPGSCGPVGLKVPTYVDTGVEHMANYIVGANKDDVHLKNVNHPRDFEVTKVADLRLAKEGDISPDGKTPYKVFRGIEVGHVFYLGTKYSEAMGAKFQDEGGKLQPIEMGCYGIGVSRTVQAAIEQSHDENGVVWPDSITPFHVHLALLDINDESACELAHDIYSKCWAQGIEVFIDDRKERPGSKFKDADLIGFPVRIVLGKRGLENGEIEWFERQTQEKKSVKVDEIMSALEARFEKVRHS